MTDAGDTDRTPDAEWLVALTALAQAGVFTQPEGDEARPTSLWNRLREASTDRGHENDELLARLLGQIASFSPRADDWASPYEPLVTTYDGRTSAPDDLTQTHLGTLSAVAAEIPDALLRARVCDVLACRSNGRARFDWFRLTLDAMVEAELSGDSWARDRAMWDRALLIAERLGVSVSDKSRALTDQLITHFITYDSPSHLGSVADLLAKHRLGRERAAEIAARLRELATRSDSEGARGFRDRAARWHHAAGDRVEALADTVFIIRSLIAEAEVLTQVGDPNTMARTAHLYERALKLLREVPKVEREAAGLSTLTTELANRIRAAGAATLGSMGVFQSDPIDLTDSRRQSVEAVSGKDPIDALKSFVALIGLASWEESRAEAVRLLDGHPLQALFSNVHYSREGRVVHRSPGQGGEPIYGEDPALWRNMIQSYEFRVSIIVQGSLSPAWVALSNEHRLTVEDFYAIARGSSIIPSDRENLIARALYYGYDGDFISAAQLAAPQVENIVRHHMRNAGQVTSSFENGVEQEIGLSALMSRDIVTEIFGNDVAFEIRALFCGPIGPNLRNEYAHGLVDDSGSRSTHAFYCWWLLLRLAFIPFWNRLHDSDTVDSQEPAQPRQDASEPEGSSA